MNDAIEFVRDIRHCAAPWTWNLLEEDGEITYSPDRADAVGGGDLGVPCGNRLKFGHLCVHNLFS